MLRRYDMYLQPNIEIVVSDKQKLDIDDSSSPHGVDDKYTIRDTAIIKTFFKEENTNGSGNK